MRVQRREATDALARDGETAVLIDGNVLRLGELSATIYALAEEPVELANLARELESRFGAPAGRTSLDATEGAVAEMIHHGILVDCPQRT